MHFIDNHSGTTYFPSPVFADVTAREPDIELIMMEVYFSQRKVAVYFCKTNTKILKSLKLKKDETASMDLTVLALQKIPILEN